MKGLHTFVSDIRACRSREQEEKRINKELGHIRQKFKEGGMDGYNRRKYVAKLLYMALLGYQIDFGHVEAANLLASPKYKEKAMGYLAVTLLFNEASDAVMLVVNAFKKDLDSDSDTVNCLALNAIANLGGPQLAESLGPEVAKKLLLATGSSFVKKKAALCLLKLYRRHPSAFQPSDWVERLPSMLLHADLGVATSAASLVLHLASENPLQWLGARDIAIQRLSTLVARSSLPADAIYYKVPVPWLQVKLLQIIQVFAEHPVADSALLPPLTTIVAIANDSAKNQQQINAQNAVFFEAVRVLMRWRIEGRLLSDAVMLLTRMISSKDLNARYLALETFALLLDMNFDNVTIPADQERIVMAACKDRDPSVRQQALDVVYRMASPSNGVTIVSELVGLIAASEAATRESLVLRCAILSEKYSPSFEWYFETMCHVIARAGDQASEDVWFRIVSRFSHLSNEQAAPLIKLCMAQLTSPTCTERLQQLCVYLVGERGDALVGTTDGGGPDEWHPSTIFETLYHHYAVASAQLKAQFLSSFVKLVNLFPELRGQVEAVLQAHLQDSDIELQERAWEYLAVLQEPEAVLIEMCDQMPAFEGKVSTLELKLAEHQRRKRGSSMAQAVESKPSISAATTTVVTQQAATGNLLDFSGGSGAPGMEALSEQPKKPTAASGDDNKAALARFISAREGVLYQDDAIQVGCVVSIAAPGRSVIVLYLGNKTTVAFDGVQADVTAPGGAIQTRASALPPTIGAGTQERLAIECLMTKPSSTLPVADIRYYCGGAFRQHVISLPALLFNSADPVNVSMEQFHGQWTTLQANASNCQAQVFNLKASTPAAALATVVDALRASKFTILQNPSVPAAIFACAQFNLGVGSPSYALIRCQFGGQQVQFEVAANTPEVKDATMQCLEILAATL
ncbi:adaptin N terminal region-domain-containing protein [Blastocladiella britannica]|nr:adaptin N terminal region-domain-containing protein [Blastocladiella britannica]